MDRREFEIYSHYRNELPETASGVGKQGSPIALSALADRIDALFLDAWGTLYIESVVFPGTRRSLQFLRERGIALRLVTNNASVSAEVLCRSLSKIGIDFSPGEIVSSGGMLRESIALTGVREVFHIGRPESISTLTAAELSSSDSPADPVVVLTSTSDLLEDAVRMKRAIDILKRPESLLYIVNPDVMAPYANGSRGLVAGAVGWDLLCETGCRTEWIGKPFPKIFRKALASLPADCPRVVMAGDTLGTDIAGGNSAGIETALLLEGNSSAAEWKSDAEQLGVMPDFVLSHFAL